MKVSVVECNNLRKNTIFTMLKSLGWDLLFELDNFEKIDGHLNKHTPDLIIGNISLGSKSVIKQFIEETTQKSIPVLFLMAFDENEEAISPLRQQEFKAALSLLVPNNPNNVTIPVKGIEVRGKQQQKIRVSFDDILWIEVERNYCFIKTQNNRYGLITSLSKLIPSLDERFIQIHRGCIVNADYIDLVKISQQELKIKNTTWTIGRLYKTNVMAYLANKR